MGSTTADTGAQHTTCQCGAQVAYRQMFYIPGFNGFYRAGQMRFFLRTITYHYYLIEASFEVY